MNTKNKVLLAFSGGLDTTYCARYLAVECNMEVHTVVVNTGGFTTEDLQKIEGKAIACDVASHTTLDRTQQLYNDVLRYCIAGNILKNNTYPLSVSAERVVQAIAIAEHAQSLNVTHVAHGSTGAGNDQIRFDVIFRTLCPHIQIITPIRDNTLTREQEIAYLVSNGIEGEWTKAAYSINQGIWGTSIGGRETLTANEALPEHAWFTSNRDANAQQSRTISIGFDRGEPCSLNEEPMSPVDVITSLNTIGSEYQLGRDYHVGDTIVGIKGRIAFEAPAAMMLIKAHHLLEKHTLSKLQLNLKDQLATWYGQLLHEGQFLDPAMRSIEAFFVNTQKHVTGQVHLDLYPRYFEIHGITSNADLMNSTFATYGEENNAWSANDVKGFAAIASITSRLHNEK